MSYLDLLGVELKVWTRLGQEISGQLYAEDPLAKVIILCNDRESRRDFHFINTDAIVEITPSNTFPVIDRALYNINVGKILDQSKRDIRREAAQLARMNLQASSEAQFIFKEFSRHYECNWEGDVILVLPVAASIHPPYVQVVCKDSVSDYLSKLLKQAKQRFSSRD